jgi:probable HAF family extracellular repeat protein
MKVKSILSFVIVISILLIRVTFAAPPRYEIIDLGRFFSSDNSFAINSSGQVAGSSSLWENGVITELGTLGGWYTLAHGINDAGQVVGHSHTAPSATAPYRAFLWENGIIKAVEPIVDRSVANGINDLGQIVGKAGGVAVLWENGTMTSLGVPWSGARDINNSGDVVGQSNWCAFLWKAGVMIDLGTLGGLYSCAEGINDSGEVVGWAQTPGGDYRAFLWESGVMTDLGTLDGTSSYAYAINNRGQVVGGAATADGDWAAFIWQDGVMTNLNDLIPADCNVFLGGVDAEEVYIGINDAGQIACHNNYTGESFLLLPVPRTIYVDDDASGANDGSSWADAYNYLQDALAAAYSGDEIHVAQGIYKPDQGGGQIPSDRTATFQLVNGVVLQGGYAGLGQPDPNARNIDLYETILSGDLSGNDEPYFANNGENSYHVVTGSGTDANAVLDGFTVIGGHANSSSPRNQGGGMYNYYGSPTLVDCIFMRNAALDGGGVSNYFGNPTLNNCRFIHNGAFYSKLHHSGGNGGGMFNSESNPAVINCTFYDGYADILGGGTYNSGGSPAFSNCEFGENASNGWGGGGMHNKESSPILSNCRFNENVSGSGGGITNQWSDLVLTNCSFSFNVAPDGGGGMSNGYSSLILTNCTFVSNLAGYASFQFGGGVMNFRSTLTLTNCEFRSNLAGSSGGGMHNDDSVLTLTDCVFTNNEATVGGGMYNNDNSVVMLTDCVFTNNEAGIGGGMYNYHDSNSTLLNCIFSENSAYSEWFSDGGGGIAIGNKSNSTVTNCLFSGNSAQYTGGSIHNWGGSSTLTNCIFSSNSAGYAGAAIYVYNGRYSSYNQTVNNCTFYDDLTPNGNALACDSYGQQYPGNVQITNSILWDEPNQIWNNDNSTITVTYSDINSGWPGEGNIDVDPQFINPVSGDYHLLPSSPCINTGDPNYIVEPNETDLDGKPRVIGGRIDMGAYEAPIFAEAEIEPDTLNLQSKGTWITVFIRLPEDYNVADIDPNSILLENEIEPERFWLTEDNQIAIAKFNREEVQNILSVGQIELTITGQLTDGTIFEGTDVIRVIDKGGGKSVK